VKVLINAAGKLKTGENWDKTGKLGTDEKFPTF
jgi:hypothetical protein